MLIIRYINIPTRNLDNWKETGKSCVGAIKRWQVSDTKPPHKYVLVTIRLAVAYSIDRGLIKPGSPGTICAFSADLAPQSGLPDSRAQIRKSQESIQAAVTVHSILSRI